MLPRKLAFIDIETTGTRPNYDRIIEVGILRVEDGKLVKTFQSLINPGVSIPEEIIGLTGITNRQLAEAPSFWEIAKEILESLNDCYFVAHSARFDYSFLKQELKRLEYSFSAKQICTVKLSRTLFPQFRHHNLDSIIERFGFEIKNRHRAFDDAEILWKFYQKIQKQFDEEKIFNSLNQIFKRPSIPLKISEEILDSLPETPGVYIFYGQNRSVLYVGKSINIRKRVLQHFASDYLSSKELRIAQLIEDIEFIETPGEMGALIKEAALIKKLQPIYNRMLRNSQEILVIKKFADKNGYLNIKLETVHEIGSSNLDSIITIARSKRQAQSFLLGICKEYGLCEKLLSLENTKGACFGYRLGRCQGACIGEETSVSYNARFEMAISKHKIHPWPYSSPILVKESGETAEEGFLIDKWMLLGQVKASEQMEDWDLTPDAKFDFDTYKILRNFLKTKRNIEIIPLRNYPDIDSAKLATML